MKHSFPRIINIIYEKEIIKYFFYGLVFVLPFQTRVAYFTEYSHFNRVYIFYNTLFAYLTDILAVLVISLWLIGVILGKFHVKHLKVQAFHLLFFLSSFISILLSQETNGIIQYFGLFKLFIIFSFFCFILNFFVKQMFHEIFWLILAISILEIILAIYQYFYQRSLGLKIVGEEFLRNYLPGVASFHSIWGQRWIFDKIFDVYRETIVIRPYGTFPHPNVYGAFIFVSLIVSYYLFFVSRETWKRVMLGFVIFLEIFGLFMSFSRVAMLAWVLATGLFFLILFVVKQKELDFTPLKSLLLVIFFSTVACFTLFYPQFLERGGVVSRGTTNQVAVSDRILYQKIAWEMIKKNPLTGVGYQNFVLQMDKYSAAALKDYQHQPVHNLYLLVAAEIGIFGSLFFVLFIGSIIWLAFKSPWDVVKTCLFAIFMGFLVIGLFDHYLLTIQQGRLLFFLVAGLLVVAAQDVTPKSENSSRSSEIETKIIRDTA